jgi:4'-phosphopantetheinyl transferase
MAHTADLAVYAFTMDCELGVDVEQVREVADMEHVAARFFSKPEARELMSVRNQSARQEAFFRCWTRKEAYLKAIGSGLSLPLDSFQVTLLADAPPRFVEIGKDPTLGAEWTLQHLTPVPGYVGALAYHSPARNIVFRSPQSPQMLLDYLGY